MILMYDKLVVLLFIMFYVAGQWIPRPGSVGGNVFVGIVLYIVGWFLVGVCAGISKNIRGYHNA